MAYISGSAALGSPFIINGEMLGGIVVDDSNDRFTGLPVFGTNTGGASFDTQAMLRTGFPTGSIIAALNHAVESADFSGGDGIDVTSGVVSVDLKASDPGLAFDGSSKLTVSLGALSEATLDPANDQIAIIDANDSSATKREAFSDVVTAMAGDGIAAASGVLSLDLSELTAATVDVANDSIAIVDATDGGSKQESIVDLAAGMAGTGIGAASGALSLAFSELSTATLDPAADSLPFLDATGNSSKLEAVTDFVGLIAGTGTAKSSNTLALDLNGLSSATVNVAADSIAFIDADDNSSKKESIADLATAMAGAGVAASSGQFALDLNGVSAGTIAVGADSFVFIDADDSNGSKKDLVSDVVSAMAGNGLAASSGVLSLSLNGLSAAALDPTADSIAFIDADDSNATKKESVNDMVTLLAGKGVGNTSSKFAVDLNSLDAAAVDVANDSIAIIDADDNSSKKESIVDLVAAMAGSGVGAASGQFSIGGSNVATFNADTLRLVGTASTDTGSDTTTFKLNVVGGILKVVAV